MLQPRPSIRPYMQFLFVQSGFPLELPFPRFVSFPKLLRARPTGAHPCGAKPPVLANQPYSRRLLCSSGLGFRIIAALCGLSPQFAYRVGRTNQLGRDDISHPYPILICISDFEYDSLFI